MKSRDVDALIYFILKSIPTSSVKERMTRYLDTLHVIKVILKARAGEYRIILAGKPN